MSSIRHGEGIPQGWADENERSQSPDYFTRQEPKVEVFEDEENVFDDLKAALTAQIVDHIESIVVPKRPNIYVRYNCAFDYDTLKTWQKSARDRSSKNKETIDPKKLAKIVLHATCVGIEVLKDGKKIEWAKEGRSQTFDSPEIQNFLDASLGGWSQAITNMYASDGHMMQVLNRILVEAGYSELDLDDADGYDPLG